MRYVALLVVALAATGCMHDFDRFLPVDDGGALDAPVDAQLVDAPVDTHVEDSADDGAAKDGFVATDVHVDDAPVSADAKPVACGDPEGKSFEGHCYFPLLSSESFASARAACAARGAHLVTITSAAEESFVETLRPGRDRWIGLARPSGSPASDASYAWITGEPKTFRKWAVAEPNGTGECARLRGSDDWGDEACNKKNDAICERE